MRVHRLLQTLNKTESVRQMPMWQYFTTAGFSASCYHITSLHEAIISSLHIIKGHCITIFQDQYFSLEQFSKNTQLKLLIAKIVLTCLGRGI